MKAPKRQDTNTEEKNIGASAHNPRHLRFRNLADMPMSLPTVNHALLHSYLNVESPDEIARLAAVMTSTLPEAFDAQGLVRAAVALRQEATAYVRMG